MAKRFFFVGAGILVMVTCSLVFGLNYSAGNNLVMQNLSPTPPVNPVRLIFIHHSTGENWLNDDNGGLGIALRDNNYYVSDTNYGWPGGNFSIGDSTDIGNWWDWFRGPESSTYLSALYDESGHNCSYSYLSTAPSGQNEIVMFKSCFPNSALQGNPNDPVPSIDDNPLRGQDSGSEYHTVANAKGIYIDILEYFRSRQDKLFIVITAPPLRAGDTNTAEAANARAFNNWLVNEWLAGYSYKNVAVFDFYNVLTSNGGNADTNDLGLEAGNHHRWWNGAIQHIQTVNKNVAAYPSDDSHPSQAGNLKATGEFLDLLNIAYNRWKGEAPPPSGETVSVPSILSGPTSGTAGIAYTYSTGGAVSSLGDSTEYQFDWKGDGSDLSSWGSATQSKTWMTGGNYTVKARARCATHTSVISGWSSGLLVNISGPTETVSTPHTPSGSTSGTTGTSYHYSTGGSSSSLDHDIEYQFDWKGDGSDLSSWGSATQTKTWTATDTYNVRARARCATDTSVVSNWSNPLTVTISAAGPDLGGSWIIPVTQTCKNTRSGPKCTIKGTLQIVNNGNRDAAATHVDFYLSDNATYEDGDTPLKSVSTGKIKVGRSKSIKLSLSLPVRQTANDKYIIAFIDRENTLVELDKANNIIVSDAIP